MRGRGAGWGAFERRHSRRDFLASGGKAALGGALAANVPLRVLASSGETVFTDGQARTLDAALARMVPAEHSGDWSAADLGVRRYIERLLEGRVYAGGPIRQFFRRFQRLGRWKRKGWDRETDRLRRVYTEGLAELDRRAGGHFAALPSVAQDAVLRSLDLEGSEFFTALYHHTMEGTYSHPVYGGNRRFTAWEELHYEGDVHGVRFPGIGGPDAAWNEFGGYAPEEMIEPGAGPRWTESRTGLPEVP